MQCRCPACQSDLTYEGEPPRFCSRCGQSLSTVHGPILDETGAYTPDKTFVSSDLPSLNPVPEQIGGYRMLRKIGSGGMGAVYEAEDLASGQKVALKLVKRGNDLSDSSTQRFRQEGRLASSISHPRCVFVIAADEDRGQPYIVMELMPGQTFADLVRKKGPLPVSRAVALIHDIIEGLQEAHRLGLVHRDVKPANCFLDEQGRAKIGDFGLAKVLDQKTDGDAPTAVELTGTGTFIGTPLYAAPEQIKGQTVDQQVDVYAVGATLYYLLTGKAPFEEQQSVTAVLARIMTENPDPLSSVRQDLPVGLEAVVNKALERERTRRFRDLESLRQALQPYVPGRTRIVRLGLRVAAFVVDMTAGMLAMGVFGLLLGVAFTLTSNQEMLEQIEKFLSDEFLSSLIFAVLTQTLVFLLPETLWGMTLGKWLFRLRLTDPGKGGKPAPRKVLLRNGIFFIATMLLQWVMLLTIHARQAPVVIGNQAAKNDAGSWHVDAGDPLLSDMAGLILLSLTMRRRNGYRGLHELLSGTATIWLPAPPPRGQLNIARHASTIPPGARKLEKPIIIGGFSLTHELWSDGKAMVYIGRDERLARPVWLWMRPSEAVRTEVSRRTVSRPGRWRWVGSGFHEGRAWDAYLATPGVSLQSLINHGSILDWSSTYHMLAELTEELRAAQTEQNPPRILSPYQLWFQQRGSVQWLDTPFVPNGPAESNPTEAEQLGFLGDSSRVALEGSKSMPGNSLKRAIPVGGYELINRLLARPVQISSLHELQNVLEQVAEQPFVLTRWARLRSFLTQAGWFLVLMLTCLALLGGIGLAIHAATEEWSDWEKASSYIKAIVQIGMPLTSLGIAMCWSAWWRGRWSFGLIGLEVRRHDGARIERWRMAWRTCMLMTPFLLLQWLSSYFQWTSRWQGLIVQWNQLQIVVLFVITLAWILISPARAWHDRLAGTVLVPK